MRVSDVFKTKGVPKHTYVSVTAGKYEQDLEDYIMDSGTLCLVTGPSKTGKTTLVAKVCAKLGFIPLEVRCVKNLTVEEFWRRALEQINFTRIEEIRESDGSTLAGKGAIKGNLGWKWLASLAGEVTGEYSKARSEDVARRKVLAAPCAQHLLPLLQRCNVLLVVEDFHYLPQDVQKAVFQEWKVFVDREVSVVVLETTQHSCDLAHANQDLLGRVGHISLTTWLKSDLKKIADKGFKVLKVKMNKRAIEIMTEECAGLPILMQSLCAQALKSKGILKQPEEEQELKMYRQNLYDVFHTVVERQYSQLEDVYHTMKRGLRQDKRKYKAYECILSAFAADPVAFNLTRDELRTRVDALPLPKSRIPPYKSLKHALEHLEPLQDKIGVTMLEWVERKDSLYIVEPAFLFYLRWIKPRKAEPDLYDIFEELFEGVTIVRRKTRTGNKISVRFANNHTQSDE